MLSSQVDFWRGLNTICILYLGSVGVYSMLFFVYGYVVLKTMLQGELQY